MSSGALVLRSGTRVPVLPPGELDKTYASSLILAYSLHFIKTLALHPRSYGAQSQLAPTALDSRAYGSRSFVLAARYFKISGRR